ncbi:MAG: hypothetical protein FWG54_05445 [Bacteroidetes bacterium]|nr:hypothetical protein [Bacteroidota bacterium]
MEKKSNKLLKIVGILMIIGSIISIILGLVVGGIAALFGGLNLITFAALLMLAGGIVNLIAGICGVKYAAKPEKANTCILYGVLTAALVVLSNILYVSAGSGMNTTSLITGLLLPALYLIGAYQNKKLA